MRLNEPGASVTQRLDWLLEDELRGTVVLSTGNITFDESRCPLRADCFIPRTQFVQEIPGGALDNVIQHEGRQYFSLVGLSSYEEPPVTIDIAGRWAGVWARRDKVQASGALSAEFFQTDGHLSGGFRGLDFFISGNPDARGTVDGTIRDSGGVDFDVVFSAPEFTGEFQGSFAKNRGSGTYALPFDRFNKTGRWRLFRQADSPATVVIDSCSTGVPNIFFDGQHTLSEKIEGCAVGALTRDQFRSCVNLFLEGLKGTGIITSDQKRAINQCAKEAAIP